MSHTHPLSVMLGYQLCDALLSADQVMFDTLLPLGPDLSVCRTVSDRILRPLELAIRGKLDYQVLALLEAGAPVGPNEACSNTIQQWLMRPFTFSAVLQQWDYCRWILERVDPSTRQHWLSQDLREAAAQGWESWVEPLIDMGAQAEHSSAEGNTPLFFAVIGGSTSVIDKLLAAGASWNTCNNQGQSAADLVRANRPDLAERYQLESKGTVINLSDRIRTRASRTG